VPLGTEFGRYLAYVAALCGLLVGVCWLKGEPPRWRWGNDETSLTRASAVPGTSRESTPGQAGLLWEAQGLVQMRVVEDIPEPIYGLPVSPRLIGNHLLDRSQRKRENCVAAALQRRSKRLETDEFAESQTVAASVR
jgi:hypothetical protein